MNQLLKDILAMTKQYSNNAVKVSSIEDVDIAVFTFSSTLEKFFELSAPSKNLFENLFVSLEVNYEEDLFEYEQVYDFQEKHILNLTKEIKFKISINKRLRFNLDENVFIFFTLDSFIKSFDTVNFNFFKRINEQKTVVVHIPIDTESNNEYLLLKPLESFTIHNASDLSDPIKEEGARLIKIREETSRLLTAVPIPHFFYFQNIDEELKMWHESNLFYSSFLHLSNKIVDRKITIRGHKNTEIELENNFFPVNASILYSIFKFSYEEKHYSDKIEISRNILTLYLNSNETVKKIDELLPKIYKTITSHFSAYIKDSIKKFFSERKDVIKEAHKFASDLRGEADKLQTYINTSLIGIITAVFSGALGLSRGERWFLLVAFAFHCIYFAISYFINGNYVRKKSDDIIKLYDDYTAEFVVLDDNDVADIKKTYIEPSMEGIEHYLRRYRNITIWLVTFMLVLILTGLFLPDNYFSAVKLGDADSVSVTQDTYNQVP
ncbi:hypothetical protein [Cohnella cellulosilytica]|uniref:Uncharacterized protein n=1 Tax=Cohnella cellulosilytica TaxID=986710 RepID=A0ABW2FAR9_9BACL